MRTVAVLVAVVPLLGAASSQTPSKEDPSKAAVEVTGCVRGSTLTESNLRIERADESPARRWRLRGGKELMKRIKQHEGRELTIAGTTKNAESATLGGRRIGKTSIYIGGDPNRTMRDPLPELPTIEVASFELTGEHCR